MKHLALMHLHQAPESTTPKNSMRTWRPNDECPKSAPESPESESDGSRLPSLLGSFDLLRSEPTTGTDQIDSLAVRARRMSKSRCGTMPGGHRA